jgi:hypothetical protein
MCPTNELHTVPVLQSMLLDLPTAVRLLCLHCSLSLATVTIVFISVVYPVCSVPLHVSCPIMPATQIYVEIAVLCYKPKVAGSIPDEVIGFFTLPNPSSRTMYLGSAQSLTEISISVKGGRRLRLRTAPPSLSRLCGSLDVSCPHGLPPSTACYRDNLAFLTVKFSRDFIQFWSAVVQI